MMTPSQMLSRSSLLGQPPPVPTGPQPTGVNHILTVEALPANTGHKAKRSTVEPWILEQFDNGACPTCGEHLFHLRSKRFEVEQSDFYFCESDKSHRWTLVEG